MKDWNSKQVANWLMQYGRKNDKQDIFREYAAKFIVEDISGSVLLSMSIDDCVELGIRKKHAKSILKLARGFA